MFDDLPSSRLTACSADVIGWCVAFSALRLGQCRLFFQPRRDETSDSIMIKGEASDSRRAET
jgi:hypothetical protein